MSTQTDRWPSFVRQGNHDYYFSEEELARLGWRPLKSPSPQTVAEQIIDGALAALKARRGRANVGDKYHTLIITTVAAICLGCAGLALVLVALAG